MRFHCSYGTNLAETINSLIWDKSSIISCLSFNKVENRIFLISSLTSSLLTCSLANLLIWSYDLISSKAPHFRSHSKIIAPKAYRSHYWDPSFQNEWSGWYPLVPLFDPFDIWVEGNEELKSMSLTSSGSRLSTIFSGLRSLCLNPSLWSWSIPSMIWINIAGMISGSRYFVKYFLRSIYIFGKIKAIWSAPFA